MQGKKRMSRSDVLREVDPESRRLAKTLMRTSHYASLACLHPDTGIPLASQINVATDMLGHICFLISQLSAHFGALEADPRCSVLLGVPGKGDPAAPASPVSAQIPRVRPPVGAVATD